ITPGSSRYMSATTSPTTSCVASWSMASPRFMAAIMASRSWVGMVAVSFAWGACGRSLAARRGWRNVTASLVASVATLPARPARSGTGPPLALPSPAAGAFAAGLAALPLAVLGSLEVAELDRRLPIGGNVIEAKVERPVAVRSFHCCHDLLHVAARLVAHWPCSCREPLSGSFDQAGRASLPSMTGCIPGGIPPGRPGKQKPVTRRGGSCRGATLSAARENEPECGDAGAWPSAGHAAMWTGRGMAGYEPCGSAMAFERRRQSVVVVVCDGCSR